MFLKDLFLTGFWKALNLYTEIKKKKAPALVGALFVSPIISTQPCYNHV